jgi:hypothetical protein
MRIKIIAGTLCLVWLAGCASTPPPVAYKSNPRWSEARNVMEAAHIPGMQDISYQKYQEAKNTALAKGMKLDTGPSVLGGTTFGALNYMSPPTGFSSGAAGLMGLASWMLTSDKHPGLDSHIFAWMPDEGLASEDAALTKFYGILKEAITKTVNEFAWPDGYQASILGGVYSRYDNRINVMITGGDCDKAEILCGYHGFIAPLPRHEPAPDILGSGNAYVFGRLPIEGKHWLIIPGVSKSKVFNPEPGKPKSASNSVWYAGFPDLEFYTALTRNLPKWVYIYLAPQHWSIYDGTKYILPKYPVVINQGRVLYFVEPAPSVQ